MTDDALVAMSVLPGRPTAKSSMVAPSPGQKGWHHYNCWCDVYMGTLVTRWNQLHPDRAALPTATTRVTKAVAPFAWVCLHP